MSINKDPLKRLPLFKKEKHTVWIAWHLLENYWTLIWRGRNWSILSWSANTASILFIMFYLILKELQLKSAATIAIFMLPLVLYNGSQYQRRVPIVSHLNRRNTGSRKWVTYLDTGDVVLNTHDHESVGHLVCEGHGSVHECRRFCVSTWKQPYSLGPCFGQCWAPGSGPRSINERYGSGSGSGSFPFLIRCWAKWNNACKIKFYHKILEKI